MREPQAPPQEPAPHRYPPRWQTLGLSLLVNGLAPLLVYTLLRAHVDSDASALALGGVIPAAWTVTLWLWRRRIDPIGVLAVGGFGLALAVTVAAGGSALPLKLRRQVATGLIGVACLVSVGVRRPLLLPALRLLVHLNPARARAVAPLVDRAAHEPATQRTLTVATAVIGVALLGEAAVQTLLAVALPTSMFLAVRLAIGGSAAAFLLWSMRQRRNPH